MENSIQIDAGHHFVHFTCKTRIYSPKYDHNSMVAMALARHASNRQKTLTIFRGLWVILAPGILQPLWRIICRCVSSFLLRLSSRFFPLGLSSLFYFSQLSFNPLHSSIIYHTSSIVDYANNDVYHQKIILAPHAYRGLTCICLYTSPSVHL